MGNQYELLGDLHHDSQILQYNRDGNSMDSQAGDSVELLGSRS